jgi:hypothetical protein
VYPQCLDPVSTTTRIEPAARRQHRRDHPLVDLDQPDQRPGKWGNPVRPAGPVDALRLPAHRESALSSVRRARSTSAANRAEFAVADFGNARTTTREPGGTWSSRSRSTCRSRRATRCRTTELPTALLTTNPTRGDGPADASRTPRSVAQEDGAPEGTAELDTAASVGAGAPTTAVPGAAAPRTGSGTRTCITTSVRPARRPCRSTVEKSSRWVNRAAAGSTVCRCRSGGQLLPALAAARGQDRPAGAGPHPEPEAVGARTTAVVRLKGALALAHFAFSRSTASWSVHTPSFDGPRRSLLGRVTG